MKGTPGVFWAWVRARLPSFAARRPAAGLSVAARLELGAKKSLLVVEYGKRRFLVGSGAETISAILEIDAAAAGKGAEPQDRRPRRQGRTRTRTRAKTRAKTAAKTAASMRLPVAGERLSQVPRGAR